MLALAVVVKKGGKPAIMVGWNRAFHFAEPGPPLDSLVALDLPGLRSFTPERFAAWLAERNRERGDDGAALSRRREVLRIPPDAWRPAVLDDFLEVAEWNWLIYHAVEFFPLADFHDFARRHLGEAEARLGEILAAPEGAPRLALIRKHEQRVERIHGVALRCPDRMRAEYAKTLARLERARWDAARAASEDPRHWLTTLAGLTLDDERTRAVVQFAKGVRRLAGTDPVAASECILALGKSGRLRNTTAWHHEFWKIAGPLVQLPPPVTGITLDVTDARQVTVEMSWDFLKAARVGPVTPGRSALAVPDRNGRITHYVHADRRLKFRLAKTGSIQKHGCTLTQRRDTEKSLAPALLEIERLDTLANVNPDLALEAVADLALPPDHLVYRTAAAAREDPRHRRALAALLVELRYGIDADVARHLARQQTGRR